MIGALANRVILADGWRRAAWALGAGAIGALAMPPLGVWPALALSLPIAVWLVDGSSARGWGRSLGRAALAGWLWGLGYFVAGLWWIGAAFLVEADTFAWLMPFGVLGLPALLAVFPAFGFALARALWSPGAARILALAFGLACAEWLRGHLFTGFPWNALGLAFGQSLWLMQAASVVGMNGLTLLVAMTLAAPATLASEGSTTSRYRPSAIAAAAILALALFGAWRVPSTPSPGVANVRLRIMQPNLSQDAKFKAENSADILRRYLALSDRATSPTTTGLAGVTHLVWPESAFPFLLHREPFALGEIATALAGKTVLVTGAAREAPPLPGETGRRYYNAIQVVGPDGAIVSTYDKVHLVPFGEYVPSFLDTALRTIGIRQFVHIPGGFSAGERRAVLKVPGLPDAVGAVCYEAIFADEIMPPGGRPGLILNVTNDGWFGDTPGPHQHFAQARLRAVEQGLPLVRAANTGISGVVDPYGRVLAQLPVGQEGVIDSALPRGEAPTIYGRLGILLSIGMYTTAGAAVLLSRRRRYGRSGQKGEVQ